MILISFEKQLPTYNIKSFVYAMIIIKTKRNSGWKKLLHNILS